MIQLFDLVRIKANGVIGTVVDISENGVFVVESKEQETKTGAYAGKWPLYDCYESDLLPVELPSEQAVAIN